MAKWEIKSAGDYAAAGKAIQDRLDAITESVQRTTTRAVTDVALDLLGRAVERAPVDNGDLRGSGYAVVNGARVAQGMKNGGIAITGAAGEVQDGVVEAVIGFTAPYAFVQHEHVEFYHPLGGQAKYLESVVVERTEISRQHMADAVKDGIRGDDA